MVVEWSDNFDLFFLPTLDGLGWDCVSNTNNTTIDHFYIPDRGLTLFGTEQTRAQRGHSNASDTRLARVILVQRRSAPFGSAKRPAIELSRKHKMVNPGDASLITTGTASKDPNRSGSRKYPA